MRLSQFQQLLQEEFGSAFSAVLVQDTRITELADRTPAEAIAAGTDPKDVWLAICRHSQVPLERWHGKTRRHAEGK